MENLVRIADSGGIFESVGGGPPLSRGLLTLFFVNAASSHPPLTNIICIILYLSYIALLVSFTVLYLSVYYYFREFYNGLYIDIHMNILHTIQFYSVS
jgi:hypothetical protein